MRIIKFLLGASVIVLLLGAVSFFAAREAFLYWGRTSLKDSIRQLARSGAGGAYEIQCTARGSQDGGTGRATVQLRFLSSTEYVLEAICEQYSFDPILIDRKELPQFVKKVPGTSGYIWGADQTGVVIEVFGDLEKQVQEFFLRDISFISKAQAIIMNGSSIIVAAEQTEVGVGPVTSCMGYGYFCCQEASEKGIGKQITGLAGCERSCFSQCIARPVILSFTPNPFFSDIKNRVVQTSSRMPVEFSVIADGRDGDQLQGVIEFGDGASTRITDFSKPVQHQYRCDSGVCQYTAVVKLTDRWGVESVQSSISTITVIVEN